jgi:hypothetical protein
LASDREVPEDSLVDWPSSRPTLTAIAEGDETGRRRVAEVSPRRLYSAATRGRLAHFLDHHPEYESADIARALSDDFRQAVTYGDIGLAVKAAHAAAEILNRLGKREDALRLQIDLIRLQLDMAGTAEEYAAIRRSALAVGSRAQDEGLLAAQAACWLLAAEGAQRLFSTSRPGEREDHLIAALRDLADVAELIAERPLNEQLGKHRARLAKMLATLSADAYAAQWSEETLLGLRAVLKRAARAARWMIRKGFPAEIYPDARDAKLAEERLLRLFREVDS